MIRSKTTCIDCHFLSMIRFDASDGDNSPKSWSQDERRLGFKDNAEREKFYLFHNHRALCFKGMWEFKECNEGKFNYLVLEEDRDEKCFFVKHRDGMRFETANELFHIENDNRQLKKSYRYTQKGLLIAAIGVAITALNVIWNFMKFVISSILD